MIVIASDAEDAFADRLPDVRSRCQHAGILSLGLNDRYDVRILRHRQRIPDRAG
jgi:hypothetical protein